MKLGLILDGRTEINALPQQIALRCEPRKRSSNGKDVSLKTIANQCAKLIRSLNAAGCRHKIIVLDREGRTETAAQIKSQLRTLIEAEIQDSFEIVVADRMFENWLLGDIEALSRKFPTVFRHCTNSTALEGTFGKSELKARMKEGTYYKPHDAIMYYKCIRRVEATAHSASYADWIALLSRLQVPMNF